jgi:manganese efflux pump family protein
MGTLEIFTLAVALGCDAFSVAVCIGLGGATSPQRLRLAFGFGGFQFLMPIVGIFAGARFGHSFGVAADYVGGAILVLMGVVIIVRAIRSGFSCPVFNHSSLFSLFTASVGVSLDALVVGFGIGLLSTRAILTTCSVIGVTAFAMASVGFEVGNRIGQYVQNRSTIVGGLILIAIGAHVILSP